MHPELLEILRCPYCGGRLHLVTSMFHRLDDDWILNGILGCQCCIFPIVDGIPVLHLQPNSTTARAHVEAQHPELALRAMIGVQTEQEAEAFEAAAASPDSTFRDIVQALGPNVEGGYFLYRFSDPTFVVGQAVVRAVAGTVLRGGRRAVDLCGGSGHLTRELLSLSSPAPVLADLYFAKAWLARRFTAPGCAPVCCDANSPLPFARGAFGYAMCSDAFQYIWTKRQFVGEMVRLIGAGDPPGAVVISHTHNQLAWSPSHGQPLTPAGYRDLFETIEARVFGEVGLFADVLKDGPLDLTRRDPDAVLNTDQALTVVASRHPDVFVPHPIEPPAAARGEYRVNPLYTLREDGDELQLTLQFPSRDYEDEYGGSRRYLPDHVSLYRRALDEVQTTGQPGSLEDLVRRRVLLDLPKRYY